MGFWEWALMAHKFSKLSMASLAMTGSWACSLQCLKMQSGQPFSRTSFSLLRSASQRLLEISAVCRIDAEVAEKILNGTYSMYLSTYRHSYKYCILCHVSR